MLSHMFQVLVESLASQLLGHNYFVCPGKSPPWLLIFYPFFGQLLPLNEHLPDPGHSWISDILAHPLQSVLCSIILQRKQLLEVTMLISDISKLLRSRLGSLLG
jgi:hypothetical protein